MDSRNGTTGIGRFRVEVSDLDGGRGVSTFRDRIAAESFVRRIAARGTESGHLTGFRIVDTYRGETVREGVAG